MSTWQDLKNNPRLKQIYDTRIKIVKLIREFFWSRNFFETETPIAVRYPGQEPYLNPVPIEFANPNGRKEKFYLHTSPEFSLKKLLAVGYEKIFYITRCFRNFEQFGGNHNTEFTMIEWYRAPGTYQEIMDDMENLFKHVAKDLRIDILKRGDKEIKIFKKWDRMSMRDVWKKHIGVNLDEYLEAPKMKELAEIRGHSIDEGEEYENIFYKIFLNEIEPKLGSERPIFIYDYPAFQAALSKLTSDGKYGQRFELYINGLELCNAFTELTDPVEQRKRFEIELAERKALGKPGSPVDEDLLGLLPSVRQPTYGNALGVDRLHMLVTGRSSIEDVLLFPASTLFS